MRHPSRFESKRLRIAGFTLIECLAAAAVSLLGMGAIMTLNFHQFRILKSSKDVNSGTRSMEERFESMRIATWRQLTDPYYLKDTLLATAPKSGAALDGLTETVTVSSYPDATTCNPIIVKRQSGTVTFIVSQGSGFSTQRLARVDLRIQWMGKDSNPRSRQMSQLITNGGISLMTLPGFGSAASGVSGTAPTPTPAPVSGGATPTPTPSATPTPTPTPAGSRVGRGNVGNPNGKK